VLVGRRDLAGRSLEAYAGRRALRWRADRGGDHRNAVRSVVQSTYRGEPPRANLQICPRSHRRRKRRRSSVVRGSFRSSIAPRASPQCWIAGRLRTRTVSRSGTPAGWSASEFGRPHREAPPRHWRARPDLSSAPASGRPVLVPPGRARSHASHFGARRLRAEARTSAPRSGPEPRAPGRVGTRARLRPCFDGRVAPRGRIVGRSEKQGLGDRGPARARRGRDRLRPGP
jgi:hypothetical protein